MTPRSARPLYRALALLLPLVWAAAPAAAQEWGPWQAIGPFDHPAGTADVATPYAPERELRAMDADADGPELGARHRGKGTAWIGWAPLRGAQGPRTELDVGVIDLNAALEPLQDVERWNENAVAYLYRRCEVPRPTRLSLALGSDDGMRLWLDGELLIDKAVARGVVLGDEHLELELEPGVHHLLVKVVNGGGGWGFRVAPWERIPQAEIDAAIDQGVEFLLKHQLIDGSWSTHEGYGSGQTAYCVYTLVKCGVPPEHPAVQRGMAWVAARPSDYTYATACELLAACAVESGTRGRAGLRGFIEERLDALIEMQEGSGLWAYPVHPNGSLLPDDLSNTLYAGLALRAVHELGVEVPERAWRRLVDGALRCLEKHADKKYRDDATPAGFAYRPGGGATGSTTTAGLSLMAIGAEALAGELSNADESRIAGARESGLAWIAKHMTWAKNPGGGHHYFWIYGIERVGGLLGLRELGGLDWYWSGAEYLVKAQRDSGAWTRDDDYIDTILALLFLKRATVPTTGQAQIRGRNSWVADGPEAQVRLHASGDTPLTVWVAGFSDAARAALEWPGQQGLGPHVTRVEFLARPAGDGARYEPIGLERLDGAQPMGATRFSAQHEFAHNGKWVLKARVEVLPPPGAGGAAGGPQVIESPELEVAIEQVVEPHLLAYATDALQNQLLDERLRVEASSHHGGQVAANAVDGRASTRWHAAVDDAAPWLEITISRAVRADRVLLTHAWPRPTHPKAPRPARVLLVVNGKQRFEVDMDADPLKKTAIELGSTLRVRQLRIEVLAARDRQLGRDAVGLAEVELLSGPPPAAAAGR